MRRTTEDNNVLDGPSTEAAITVRRIRGQGVPLAKGHESDISTWFNNAGEGKGDDERQEGNKECESYVKAVHPGESWCVPQYVWVRKQVEKEGRKDENRDVLGL